MKYVNKDLGNTHRVGIIRIKVMLVKTLLAWWRRVAGHFISFNVVK